MSICSELSFQKYKCVEVIGKGSFGLVYKAFDTTNGEEVVIKKIRLGERAKMDDIQHEIDMLKLIGSERCGDIALCYKDFFIDGQDAFLISDFVSGVTLDEYISQLGTSNLLLNLLLINILCLCLKEIHSMGIAHNDIHSKNIMIDDDDASPNIRFIDFGISCKDPCRVGGRLGYLSPEKLRAFKSLQQGIQPVFGLKEAKASDVYALGVIMFRLLNGVNPFDSFVKQIPKDQLQNLDLWLSEIYSFPLSQFQSHRPDVDVGLNRLINLCLFSDVFDRPTADELSSTVEELFKLAVKSPQ